MIPWKNRLQEYCNSQGIPLPFYNSRKEGKMWISTVTVNNMTESGEPENRKVDSEMIAAKRLFIKLLSNEENTTRNEDSQQNSTRNENKSDGGFYDLFSRRIRERQSTSRPLTPPSTTPNSPTTTPNSPTTPNRPIQRHSLSVQQIVIQRERKFPNNIFDNGLLDHLHIIVRGKNVEITNRTDYISEDAPVVIHLNDRISEIKTTLNSNSVRIDVPLVDERESFQAMILLSACMELGAASCSIVGMPSNRVDRIILSTRNM